MVEVGCGGLDYLGTTGKEFDQENVVISIHYITEVRRELLVRVCCTDREISRLIYIQLLLGYVCMYVS